MERCWECVGLRSDCGIVVHVARTLHRCCRPAGEGKPFDGDGKQLYAMQAAKAKEAKPNVRRFHNSKASH